MDTATLDPPTLFSLDGDIPRTRRTDPVTSHQAADTTQSTLAQTKVRVLRVVRDNPNIIGSEINDLYRFAAARHGWAKVAWDSPRKRAGELASDGYLEVVGSRPADGGRVSESVYRLTLKGEALLTLGGAR